MGRSCTVCNHPNRGKIDSELIKGLSANSIASRFGVGARAIGRHRLSHLSPALTAIAVAREGTRVGSLVDRLEAVTSAAERMLFKAESEGAGGQMQGWVREFRSCVELMFKVTGQLQERPTTVVNVLSTPEVSDLVTTLLRALQPFPEARIAAAQALDVVDTSPMAALA